MDYVSIAWVKKAIIIAEELAISSASDGGSARRWDVGKLQCNAERGRKAVSVTKVLWLVVVVA